MALTKGASRQLLFILVVFQAMSGIIGGIGLVFDPSGSAVGIPLEFLASSPFSNYLIPGLILLIVLGVFPLVVGVGLFRHRSWSLSGSLIVGVGLVIWIGVEILMIGYHGRPPLQLVYGILGLVILIVAAREVRAASNEYAGE